MTRLLVLLALCGASFGAIQKTGDELREGMLLMEQGKYREARDLFSQAVESDPSSAQAFFLLGTVEVRMKEFRSAESALRSALQRDPKSLDIRYNLGVLLLEQKRSTEAVTYLEQVSRDSHAGPEVYVNLIRAYLDSRNPEGALQAHGAAPAAIRDSAAFQLAVGLSFLSHDMNRQAIDSLRKADRLFSGSKDEILLPLAEACLRAAEVACAEDALARTDQETQNSAAFHFLQGKTALVANQRERAIDELRRARRQEPQNLDYALTLARCYQKYGDQQAALSLLDTATQIAPHSARIPFAIGVSYFIEDKFEAAEVFAEQALKLEPSFDRALFLYGLACLGQSKFETAVQAFEQAASRDPSNPYYECFRGMTLLLLSEDAKAASSFRRAVSLKPDYALAHYQLGRVFVRSKNYVEASGELSRAVSLEPEMTEAYYQLALVYQRTGDRERAAQAFKQFHDRKGAEESDRQQVLREVVTQARQAMLR